MPRFIPRERKHKRLARQSKSSSSNGPSIDTNTTEILPPSQTEKEDRRNTLKQRILGQQPESKLSSQKRKRLEKYVDSKLKKEENQELLRKLAEQRVDTSLLRSSKKLGRVQESKRERVQRVLKERDAIGESEEAEAVLYEPRRVFAHNDGAESEEDAGSEDDTKEVRQAKSLPVALNGGVQLPEFGSGLKRKLDVDVDGQPIIQKRKRRKRGQGSLGHDSLQQPHEDYANDSSSNDDEAEDEWKGFSEAEDAESTAEDEHSSQSSSADEDSDSPPSETSIDEEPLTNDMPARKSAFKAWANHNMNAALDFTPSANQPDVSTNEAAQAKIKANFQPRVPSPDPDLDTISGTTTQDIYPQSAPAITILRSEEVQKSRLSLPIVQEEQKVIETINLNPITIICGATGSGKTTQVAQMLFENGYKSIGITQPRRVAATSVANRVAYEMGPDFRHRVAHQVRFDTNVSKHTAIKFMTDGILLREIQNDFVLDKYDVIIIDEAHERSVNTDILIGMISRIVPLRNTLAKEEPGKHSPLRLVIMSATLRVDDFLNNDRLFTTSSRPPVLEIEGRQYTVTEHFARRTKRDYVEEMVEKVARGHRKLPAGGMLVFLTGQQEIAVVERKLRERSRRRWNGHSVGGYVFDDYEDEDGARVGDETEYLDDGEGNYEDGEGSDAEIKVTDEAEDDFAIPDDTSSTTSTSRNKVALKPHILPLYANLPTSQQQRVFQPPPEGHRMIILATNVAETSLTIPGIRYVFDCGRSKEKKYDQQTGIQSFEVGWISKANAEQRKGRAGRTGPGGHVWRLYSSAVYERDFAEHTEPEILRTSVEGVVLQLKEMEVDGSEDFVRRFPFPTAPETAQLGKAEELLKNLAAIGADGRITEMGREMMKFPVGARLGKMLVLAKKYGLPTYTIAIVAGLAVENIFAPEAQSEEGGEDAEWNRQHQAYTGAQAKLASQSDTSDAIKLLTAVSTHAIAQYESNDNGRQFCKEHWLREKGMNEVQQLRRQLGSMVNSENAGESPELATLSQKPKREDLDRVTQIVAAGFIDQVAIRADLLPNANANATSLAASGRKAKRAIEVAYRTLLSTSTSNLIDPTATPEQREIQKSVFIHPSSVLSKLSPNEMPDYIIYRHLSRAQSAAIDGKMKRTRMHPLTSISAKQLAMLAEGSPLLEIGKPIGRVEEMDRGRWRCWVEVSFRGSGKGGGGTGWPLGAWCVVQKKDGRGGWVVERVVKR